MSIRTFAKCMLRVIVLLLYGLLGALLFVHVENKAITRVDKTNSSKIGSSVPLQDLRIKYSFLKGLSQSDIRSLAKEILNATNYKLRSPKRWHFGDGVQLVFETLTTIGYGSTPPASQTGRLLVIFYALFGIPLMICVLQSISDVINRGMIIAIRAIEKKCLRLQDPSRMKLKCLLGFGITCLVFILFIAAVLTVSKEWSYIDSIYTLFITFTTIGFGDLVLKNELGGGIITVGLCLISGLFSAALSFLDTSTDVVDLNQSRCCSSEGHKVQEQRHSCTETSNDT